MKKRAIILPIYVISLLGLSSKTIFSQDTIVSGSFYVESFNDFLEIMNHAVKEQFNMNSDSFNLSFNILLNQKMNILTEVLSVPDNIAYSYGNDFERDVSTTTVTLKGESRTKEIDVNVKNKIPVMFLIIKGGVKSGNIKVEIFDPNGKKYRGFAIGSDESKNGEIVNGALNKSLQTPIIGKWAIRIDSDNAVGKIYVTSIQKLNVAE